MNRKRKRPTTPKNRTAEQISKQKPNIGQFHRVRDGLVGNVTISNAPNSAQTVKVWFNTKIDTSYILRIVAQQVDHIAGDEGTYAERTKALNEDGVIINGSCTIKLKFPANLGEKYIAPFTVNKLPFSPPENDIQFVVGYSLNLRRYLSKPQIIGRI